MIYKKKPKNFIPVFEIASCFFEANGEILLLKRHKNKSQGGKWGVPAGKININEDKENALTREILEETGNSITKEKLSFFKSVYVNHGYDFTYHMFHYLLDKPPAVEINTYEHKSYKWVSMEESLKVNLVDDLDECIRMFYFNK